MDPMYIYPASNLLQLMNFLDFGPEASRSGQNAQMDFKDGDLARPKKKVEIHGASHCLHLP